MADRLVTGTGPKLFFYVQHLLGIGHLARASRIGTALQAAGFDVAMVTGGPPVAGFPDPALRQIALPPLTAADQGFSGLVDLDGKPLDAPLRRTRIAALLAAFAAEKPDIVVLEAFPFGRRQMRFELLPLIEAIEALGADKPLLVASVRDILQDRVKPGRNEETAALVNRYFDLVMVHGDPNFADLSLSFPLADEIAGKVGYTGLVAAPAAAPSPERYDVLVSAGGGAAGARLAAAVPEAARQADESLSWALIGGPNLPAEIYAEIEAAGPANLAVFRFRTDFRQLLAGTAISVSQAGYNTVCDILQAGCRSLLVPFADGGETEQPARAWRLEQLDLARVLAEQTLTPGELAAAVTELAAGPAPAAHAVDLDGARRTADLLHELLAARGTQTA